MTVETKSRSRRTRWERPAAIVALIILLILAVVFFAPLKKLVVDVTEFLLDKDGARRWILNHQPYSSLYFLGLQILQVIFSPVPGEVSCFLGGLIFGWWQGFLLSSLGLTIGSLVNVSIGRIFERVFLERIMPARLLDRFEVNVKRWGLTTVFVLFLFPGAPKDTLCYLFGLSRIPIWSFLVVSSVARLPGTLVLSLQGAKIVEGDWFFFIVITAAGMGVAITTLIFRNRLLRWLRISDSGEAPWL
jgi:uncharacterized membrane protein YdjX (TVP38/TMEM64 family)